MVVLVINCGSSSLKYEVFEMETETVLCKGLIERIGGGSEQHAIVHHCPTGRAETRFESPVQDHTDAVRTMTRLLVEGDGKVLDSLDAIEAVGHRVVHGGEAFSRSVVVDDDVIVAIERCADLAPLHNPPNLAGIRGAMAALSGKPQVAVFDTAFHQSMPRRAFLYAVPKGLYEEHGVRRYGFHGTSHYYVATRAARLLEGMGRAAASEARIVTCHLGNGCSMAAVVGGKCVDTSMGLTPLEGLVMGTRSGDIDPAIIPFLERKLGMTSAEVDAMLNRQSGLLGLSGVSNDMRDVIRAASEGCSWSRDALDVFSYRVRKYVGAYAAAMGGVDAIVFTAGIGENNAALRADVLGGLSFLGIEVDAEANERGKGDRAVTTADSSVVGFVIGTQEELVIARQTAEACQSRMAAK